MLVVIGSDALNKALGYIVRKPVDIDIVGDYDVVISFLKLWECRTIYPIDGGKKVVGKSDQYIFECEITWPGSSAEALFNLVTSDDKSLRYGNTYHASLDVLYLLKMTHRFRKNSVHFLKTMSDIHLMRSHGATIRPEHKEFYKRRLKETLDYSHPKLNQSKKEFFTDDVPYVYDHDSIHEAVKLYRKPAYSYFKPDESEVLTSKKMFFELPYERQIAAVYEESCVLALERSQIPYPDTSAMKSFEMALQKVCTSITSGWFREFAWENYNQAIALYHDCTRDGYSYLQCFQHGLQAGVITPHRK